MNPDWQHKQTALTFRPWFLGEGLQLVIRGHFLLISLDLGDHRQNQFVIRFKNCKIPSFDFDLLIIFLQLTWVAFVIVTFYLHFLREVLHPNAISLQSYTKGPWTLDGWIERLDQTTDLRPTSIKKLLVELKSVTLGPLKLLHKKNGRYETVNKQKLFLSN